MIKVLWLCSWYPDPTSPQDVGFIQRNAQAASLHHAIHVIKLSADPNATGVTKVTRNFQQWPRLSETFIYYPQPRTISGKAVAYLRWYSLYKYAVENYIEKHGMPDLVHVQVPHKAGAIARMIKRKYRVPYVVTAHWAGYGAGQKTKAGESRYAFRGVTKNVLKEALGLQTTTAFLGGLLSRYITPVQDIVIANAADSEVFYYRGDVPNTSGKTRFLYPCHGTPSQHLPMLIEAFGRLPEDRFSLTISGLPAKQTELLKKLHPKILFLENPEYSKMADLMMQADVLVSLPSVENLQGFIGEALCCGIPVVSFNDGAAQQYCHPQNSIVAEDIGAGVLEQVMLRMEQNYLKFHRPSIAREAVETFSFQAVGAHTDGWYRNAAMSAATNS